MLQLPTNPSLDVTKTMCTLCNPYFSYWRCSCSPSVVPWRCRWCVGSCCPYDRERSTGGHSLHEAARRAAGSCLLPNTRPGGRSVCSGGSHMAAFYYTSGHKKCLAGDMGCCCVAVKQKKKCHFNHRNKKIKIKSYANCQLRGKVTSCFPMHHF